MARAQLSPLWENASGSLGPLVVARGRGGPVVRARPVYKRHQSDDQRAQERRLTAVAARWAMLTPAQAAAWHDYAKGIRRRNTVGGGTYSSSGYNVFTALSVVMYRLDPGAELPALPPGAKFAGDHPTFEVAALPGALLFAASRANAPGVVTELLIQRLPTPHRRPTDRFKSAAFATFTAGDLEAELPAVPGAYALATRFIERTTGLTTPMQIYGVVLVE